MYHAESTLSTVLKCSSGWWLLLFSVYVALTVRRYSRRRTADGVCDEERSERGIRVIRSLPPKRKSTATHRAHVMLAPTSRADLLAQRGCGGALAGRSSGPARPAAAEHSHGPIFWPTAHAQAARPLRDTPAARFGAACRVRRLYWGRARASSQLKVRTQEIGDRSKQILRAKLLEPARPLTSPACRLARRSEHAELARRLVCAARASDRAQ